MKKVITFDAVIVSLIGAMGYGFGYQIPSAYGLNSLICLAVCMVFGTVVEMAADKIIFSSYVQKNNKRRYAAYTVNSALQSMQTRPFRTARRTGLMRSIHFQSIRCCRRSSSSGD